MRWIWGLVILIIFSGCVHNVSNKPNYDFSVSISGDIMRYSMNYVDGDKPSSLKIYLEYNKDLTIEGPNLEGNVITLSPTQGLQGDDYIISGGADLIPVYDIRVTPYYKNNSTNAIEEPLKDTITRKFKPY